MPAFPATLDAVHSVLDPRGGDAAVIAEMAWVLIVGGAIIFAGVIALAAYALLAPRERAARLAQPRFVVGAGIVFPIVTLTALLLYVLLRGGSLASAGQGEALTIEVTGEQWWWRVHYLDARGAPDFATANEIHIPAGRPVDLVLRSADVLHSFWVPSLAGKLDMIPGKVNRMRIDAAQPGRYRGQCAEYCGGPHGLMAFVVVAMPEPEFRAWAQAQRASAAASASPRGRHLFDAHCSACHAVRGTAAAGRRGPDLTHVASRASLAAGLLPMGAEPLHDWIAANQRLKPGNLMPEFGHFPREDLRELTAYVAGLR